MSLLLPHRRALFAPAAAWYDNPAFAAADGTRPAAILDFAADRYALPAALEAGDVAGASPAQLARLRPAARTEAIAFAATRVAEAALCRDAAGLLRPISTSDVPRLDWSGGRRALLLEGPLTNKIVAPKHNPTGTTNIASTGTGSGSVTVVNRPDLLAAAGLDALCSNGNVYKITVTTPPWSARFLGETGNTATHVCDAYIAGSAGMIRGNNNAFGAAPSFPASDVLVRRSNVITPTASGTYLIIGSDDAPGEYYVVLPGLYEQAFAPAHPIAGATTGSVARAIETARLGPLVEALVQRAEATVVVRGRAAVAGNGSTSRRIVGCLTSTFLIGSFTATAARISAASFLECALGTGDVTTGFGIAAAFDGSGRALSANGAAAVADAGEVPDRASVYLGRSATMNTNSYSDGWYDQLVVYPRRVSAAALQALAVPA